LVDLKDSRSRGRFLCDAQDLALPFEINVLTRPERPQAIGRRRIVGLPKHGPDRGVLRTEPPQRVTCRLVYACGTGLVEGADAIEKPHVMALAIVLDEGEMWVVGFRIEVDVGFRVAGRQHRLFEGEFLGRLAFNPVIAIAANSDDGAVWLESLHALVESLLEPALAGDTAGTALLPMLAVS